MKFRADDTREQKREKWAAGVAASDEEGRIAWDNVCPLCEEARDVWKVNCHDMRACLAWAKCKKYGHKKWTEDDIETYDGSVTEGML